MHRSVEEAWAVHGKVAKGAGAHGHDLLHAAQDLGDELLDGEEDVAVGAEHRAARVLELVSVRLAAQVRLQTADLIRLLVREVALMHGLR